MELLSILWFGLEKENRRSCYRDLGDLGPPWQGKELVYQEPESIEILSSIQGYQVMMLRRLSFSNKCMSLFIIFMKHSQQSAGVTLYFVPMAVCPKCCTNLYQEREKVPSQENASTTPMFICLGNSIPIIVFAEYKCNGSNCCQIFIWFWKITCIKAAYNPICIRIWWNGKFRIV